MGGFFFDFEVIRTASSDRDAPRRYHMMGHRHAYDVWRTVDAFDYAVEHLSMYERMMHASKSGKDKGSALGDVLIRNWLKSFDGHLPQNIYSLSRYS